MKKLIINDQKLRDHEIATLLYAADNDYEMISLNYLRFGHLSIIELQHLIERSCELKILNLSYSGCRIGSVLGTVSI